MYTEGCLGDQKKRDKIGMGYSSVGVDCLSILLYLKINMLA